MGNSAEAMARAGALPGSTRHDLAIATYTTYWGIGEKRIAALLDRQKALLHACEAETSMIMALAPELVDQESLSQMHGPYIPGNSSIAGVNPAAYRWRYVPSRSPNGVIGDAATASAEKGEKLLEAIAEELAITVKNKEFWNTPI